MLTILGYFLIALPFSVLFVFCLKMVGWRGSLAIFGISALVIVVVAIGTYLVK